MTIQPHVRRYPRLVVDNDEQSACGVDAALQMFIEAQRHRLETGSAADGEAAKQALRAMMATGGDPEAAMPMHRWRHR